MDVLCLHEHKDKHIKMNLGFGVVELPFVNDLE
jgi:hypothetical protein